MLDYYDEDLPEVRTSWAESYSAGKEVAWTVTKVVSLPLLAFAATYVFNYWVKKKIGSL